MTRSKVSDFDDILASTTTQADGTTVMPRLKQVFKYSDGMPDIQDLDALHQSPNTRAETGPVDNSDVQSSSNTRTTKVAGIGDYIGKFVGQAYRHKDDVVDMATDLVTDQVQGKAQDIAVDRIKDDAKTLDNKYGKPLRKKYLKKLGYKLEGHTDFQGLKIAIENAKGSVRSGVDADGKPWRTVMKHPYGYLKGSKGADGEEVDVYVGPNKDATHAHVVHQKGDDGSYDEDKVMLGFDSKEHARKGFLMHYNTDKYLGPVKTVSMERLKDLLAEKKRLVKISHKK